jgi:hypothetical protein
MLAVSTSKHERKDSSMATELVDYEIRYPAAVITLNCPQTRNALSMPMVDAIMAALHRAEDECRAGLEAFFEKRPPCGRSDFRTSIHCAIWNRPKPEARIGRSLGKRKFRLGHDRPTTVQG